MLDPLGPGDIVHMEESVDAFLEFDKGARVRQFHDLSRQAHSTGYFSET
jgi:hypothetical protein